jgi:integrase/recombinase XerD
MIARTAVHGPLAGLADGFRAELDRLGYTPSSREFKLGEVARLSGWLGRQGLRVGDISPARVEEFLTDPVVWAHRAPKQVAMRPLLAWLRRQELCPDAEPAPAPGPLDELMVRYRRWLVTERQLAPRTIRRYEIGARLFLASRTAPPGSAGVEGLGEDSVSRFLLAEAARGLAAGSLQGRVAELRSFLRFLYLQAMIPTPLGEGVPSVPGWKDTGVPSRLASSDVQTLLDSCDPNTVSGKRDLAVLLLLARMGLRAAEVAGLELDAFDWRAGELVVRGKGRHCDRMPLPVDVGAAVATYLQVRPKAECRAVFLALVAPPRPLGPSTVSQLVWRACRRAGLQPVRAHRLRHALASELLSRGVRLPEIAQVLRQRDLATTAIYAKVDYPALAELALPWLVVQ